MSAHVRALVATIELLRADLQALRSDVQALRGRIVAPPGAVASAATQPDSDGAELLATLLEAVIALVGDATWTVDSLLDDALSIDATESRALRCILAQPPIAIDLDHGVTTAGKRRFGTFLRDAARLPGTMPLQLLKAGQDRHRATIWRVACAG